ncbi:MAG: hypothetical protein NC485_13810 [Ruminococcus flavefaciens]|nr:hypothetical protein [Ruminococcus flavefaciens]MCM1062604.1 hypothetical protein [Eubacterium sp.]
MEIFEIIDRMASIKLEKKALDSEYDKLQAQLHVAAGEELKDTKIKSVNYSSDSGNSALVTNSDKIEICSIEMLKDIFGKFFSDMVKEELKYTLKPTAKRLLAAVWNRGFCEGSIDDVVNTLSCDDKVKKVLLKKLKGIDFQKDKKVLMDFAGVSENEASDTAFLINEVASWQTISNLIKVNNDNKIDDELLKNLILKVNYAISITRELKTKITVSGGEDDE